ncbi:MAG: response regulator transcription factor [Dehalococcoidia bacterium]|jgi:DNA-binding NarL/FixJ family response regulator|nr:response regulator transcription factor [Dehalococcoidia bacterium]
MKVLLVDDHALFRAGLTSLLSAWGVEVVGQAGDGQEAITRTRELRPDLVFMDINMPTLGGLEATRSIKAEFPDVQVIMLTVSDDDQDLFEAVKSGADGYLLKDLGEDEFADLLERVSRGEPIMSPGLAKRLLQEFARIMEEPPSLDPGHAGLTPREREVLEQLTRGATNREISIALFISENTVSYHMKNIISKLHLRNRAQVVAWAVSHGFTAESTS